MPAREHVKQRNAKKSMDRPQNLRTRNCALAHLALTRVSTATQGACLGERAQQKVFVLSGVLAKSPTHRLFRHRDLLLLTHR